MSALFLNLLKDESGVTAIEYGLIAAVMAVICISAWGLLSTGLTNTFTNIASDL